MKTEYRWVNCKNGMRYLVDADGKRVKFRLSADAIKNMRPIKHYDGPATRWGPWLRSILEEE